MNFEGPYYELEREIAEILKRDDIAAYQLYETANFTRLNKQGEFEGSPKMAELVRRHGFGTT